MRTRLIVNKFDIGPYIAEDGIRISQDLRNERTITTLDGTKYTSSVSKMSISITMMDNMLDFAYNRLMHFLETNPAAVSYTDFANGQQVTGTFYIKDLQYGIKKTFDSTTLISGVSFTLEER